MGIPEGREGTKLVYMNAKVSQWSHSLLTPLLLITGISQHTSGLCPCFPGDLKNCCSSSETLQGRLLLTGRQLIGLLCSVSQWTELRVLILWCAVTHLTQTVVFLQITYFIILPSELTMMIPWTPFWPWILFRVSSTSAWRTTTQMS